MTNVGHGLPRTSAHDAKALRLAPSFCSEIGAHMPVAPRRGSIPRQRCLGRFRSVRHGQRGAVLVLPRGRDRLTVPAGVQRPEGAHVERAYSPSYNSSTKSLNQAGRVTRTYAIRKGTTGTIKRARSRTTRPTATSQMVRSVMVTIAVTGKGERHGILGTLRGRRRPAPGRTPWTVVVPDTQEPPSVDVQFGPAVGSRSPSPHGTKTCAAASPAGSDRRKDAFPVTPR